MTSKFKCPYDHKLCKAIFDGMTPKKKGGDKDCGVSVIIINEKNEILLGFDKTNDRDHWSFFSGSMDGNDINENMGVKKACLCEVAVRELKEEAAINISLENFVKYIGGDDIKNISNQKTDCNPFFVLKIANNSIDVKEINKILAEKQPVDILPAYKEIGEIQYFGMDQNLDKKKQISEFVLNQIKNTEFKKIIVGRTETIKDKLTLFSVDDAIAESKDKGLATTLPIKTAPQDTTEKDINPINVNIDLNTGQVKAGTTEETILYVDTKSSNPNMMVSTIQMNPYFKKYTKKNGTWTEDAKGGNKRKSKSTKKARRSK